MITALEDMQQNIYQKAIELGFIDCGFSRIQPIPEHEQRYHHWLQSGYQASMEYMERNADKRVHPELLVEGAKSVISLLYNYFTPEKLEGSPLKIAKYAYGQDYHDVVKDKLRSLDQYIKGIAGEVSQRCFVDSAPVLERAWAQNAGLGWIGKNSCLISRKFGSFFFIGEIITTLDIGNESISVKDYCGSCLRCIDACPTQAITNNRLVDSNRCISYHTIENRADELPSSITDKLSWYIFGCDICQDVCPWNKKFGKHNEPLFDLKPELRSMSLNDWQTLTQEKYAQLFKGSAVKRTKFNGLKRNISKVFENL